MLDILQFAALPGGAMAGYALGKPVPALLGLSLAWIKYEQSTDCGGGIPHLVKEWL
jgi:hypothetical protein